MQLIPIAHGESRHALLELFQTNLEKRHSLADVIV